MTRFINNVPLLYEQCISKRVAHRFSGGEHESPRYINPLPTRRVAHRFSGGGYESPRHINPLPTRQWHTTALILTYVFTAMLTLPQTACVRRTLTIETEPQGAIVHLNDEEIGPTPVSRDFIWYGDYDVVIRKDGYETLETHFVVNPPFYQIPPFDFFFDVLFPVELHDQHHTAYTLISHTPPTHDEVVQRAQNFRTDALQSLPAAGPKPQSSARSSENP